MLVTRSLFAFYIHFLIISLPFVLYVSPMWALEDHLQKAEKFISSMRGSLDNVAVEIRKATEKSDVSLVNCLRQKEGAMKNYVDASMKNQENLRSAWKVKDMKEADRFIKLIEMAHKNVKDIELSLKECYKGEVGEKKTNVRVIRPPGGGEEVAEELFPEEEEGGEPEGFPAVPPASPFR